MENTAVAQALESPVIGDLVFTDNAARKVKTLMEEEGNDNLMLRVFISGGVVRGFNTALLLMKNAPKMIRRWKKWVLPCL